MDEALAPIWKRSSRCDSGTCVEVAHGAARVAVRDGKNPGGPALTFTHGAWEVFVAGVRRGEFDPR